MNSALKISITGLVPKKIVAKTVGGDEFGRYAASVMERYMSKYVPRESGTLMDTTRTEPFKVIYLSPYARAMFYGTKFHFSKEKNPLATARWDKATSSSSGKKIADELTDYLKKK